MLEDNNKMVNEIKELVNEVKYKLSKEINILKKSFSKKVEKLFMKIIFMYDYCE